MNQTFTPLTKESFLLLSDVRPVRKRRRGGLLRVRMPLFKALLCKRCFRDSERSKRYSHHWKNGRQEILSRGFFSRCERRLGRPALMSHSRDNPEPSRAL